MSFAPRSSHLWQLRTRTLPLGPRTALLGILNITPDSFSDGGQFAFVEDAIEHGLTLLDQGADILDLGGESTRPGASPLSAVEEQGRILPVLRGLLRARPGAVLSVDTYHAATAQAALDAGAEIINDVSGGLWDPAMLPLCARYRPGLILMHTRGRPGDWRSLPPLSPAEVLPLVHRELDGRLQAALHAGLPRENIVLDPGFGFGKILGENLPLLSSFHELRTLGLPLAAGVSRKGFLRQLLEQDGTTSRTASPLRSNATAPEALRDATTAAQTVALLEGAHILRVHEVPPARRAAALIDALRIALPHPHPASTP